ncbi:MAG: hypothetical protein ACTFAK_09965 [Candidatus Electronema sp. VV]
MIFWQTALNCVEHKRFAAQQQKKTHHRQEEGMPRFPNSDSELIALAQKLIAGLQENPNFPSPPVSPAQLRSSLDAFIGLCECDTQTAAQAAAEQATAGKNAGREQLAAEVRGDLHYAEYAAEGDDAKLSTLGWGARSPHTPISAPGQGSRSNCK